AVVAVALSGGRRAVVEDMPLVPSASGAMVFGARQEELEVALRLHPSFQRLEEARPAGAAVELRLRAEEREAAGGAEEGPLALLVVQRAGPRSLAGRLEEHGARLRLEALAPF